MTETSPWLAPADAIATHLRRTAILEPSGAVGWMQLQHHPEHGLYRLEPTGYSLYDGDLGPALFLGAHAAVTGDEDAWRLAVATLGATRSALHHHGPVLAAQLGLGGAAGLGSVAYGLTLLSGFLGAPELLDDARRAAALVTDELIASDTVLDPIGGAAGAILGLLPVAIATGDAAIAQTLMALGDHLLATRRPGPTGHRAWPTIDGKLLTGLSHGAAGIALALDRLGRATDTARFREAAAEAVAYEASVFDPSAGNWPDWRFVAPGEPSRFMTTWCHGAPGIGLARLASGNGEGLEAAIATTAALEPAPVHHLCCGELGRCELLLEAGVRLERPALVEQAYAHAATVLAQREAAGAFRIFAEVPGDAYSVGFHRGLAGIGYAFLRLAHPGRLPSVLLWETEPA